MRSRAARPQTSQLTSAIETCVCWRCLKLHSCLRILFPAFASHVVLCVHTRHFIYSHDQKRLEGDDRRAACDYAGLCSQTFKIAYLVQISLQAMAALGHSPTNVRFNKKC
jgi:hypothetical protein